MIFANAFAYEQSDVPEGVELREWRAQANERPKHPYLKAEIAATLAVVLVAVAAACIEAA